MTVQTVKDVTDGAMLGGKYRIRRVLGQGGMGVVVEALHVELDDRVAIKFLTPRALTEPDAVQRFVREAKAAVRLRSEHIARVRDVGLLPGGDPYIVMEYLDGVELRQLFSGPRLAPSALVDLILQACEGLAEAHSLGIVHRDIKPSNLFVVSQLDGAPHVKVLDFGVSKVPLDDLHLTGTNSWMGTPAYMSPEQMRSTRNVDARSDLWSLAVVLYEGLEGRVPFPGDSLADLCINVTTMPPQPLTDRTPAPLAAVVMRALEKQPAERYASVAAFAEALAPFAETRSHAEMIVRRTRGLFERRPTPPAGVPVERASALHVVASVPSASTEHLAERPVDPPVPTPSVQLRAEVDADVAAAFEVLRVDTGLMRAGPRLDPVDGPVHAVEPDADADPDRVEEDPAVDSASVSEPPATPSFASETGERSPTGSGSLPELAAASRRSILGILAGVAALAMIVATVLFVVHGGASDRGTYPDAMDSLVDRVAPDAASSTDATTVLDPVVDADVETAHTVIDAPTPIPDTARPTHRVVPPPHPDAPLPALPDAGALAPLDVAPAIDASPRTTPDADPLGRRT